MSTKNEMMYFYSRSAGFMATLVMLLGMLLIQAETFWVLVVGLALQIIGGIGVTIAFAINGIYSYYIAKEMGTNIKK